MAFTLTATTAASGTYAASSTSTTQSPIIRAAAVDLGSGKTKMTVADVARNSLTSWVVVNTLWKTEEILKFSDDLAGAKDGKLSVEIQEKGIALLKKLKLIAAQKYGVNDFCCIATEVFRKAINGERFLARVEQEVGIRVYLIDQEQEALLGFRTGVAVGSLTPEKALVVDHGSGSFQISSQSKGTLVSFNGKLGTIPLTKVLIEMIQKTPYKAGLAPKPLSPSDAQAFVQYVHKELSLVPEWLVNKVLDPQVRVIGLAGPASTFGMCAAIVGKREFTQHELWLSIQRLFFHSEEQIQKTFPAIYDATLLPRVLFVYSLMTHLSLQKITWSESNGCAEGILITPSFWQPNPAPRSRL